MLCVSCPNALMTIVEGTSFALITADSYENLTFGWGKA